MIASFQKLDMRTESESLIHDQEFLSLFVFFFSFFLFSFSFLTLYDEGAVFVKRHLSSPLQKNGHGSKEKLGIMFNRFLLPQFLPFYSPPPLPTAYCYLHLQDMRYHESKSFFNFGHLPLSFKECDADRFSMNDYDDIFVCIFMESCVIEF